MDGKINLAEETDDFFLVIRGRLTIHLRDRDVTLDPGKMFVVPRGVEHCPGAEQETEVLLIEPGGTVNTDFQVIRSDGTIATPTCALQFPPDEFDEAQTVNLIGDFGDSVSGPTPVAIHVVGALQGTSPGARRWHLIPPSLTANVGPLSGGPDIVDAWTIPPAIYRRDTTLPGRQVFRTRGVVQRAHGLRHRC